MKPDANYGRNEAGSDSSNQLRTTEVYEQGVYAVLVLHCQPQELETLAERDMVEALADQPGVLLVNALVTSGRRTREVDGIWIHPESTMVIEAKGTSLAGLVRSHLNGPWSIGGVEADFAGGANPLVQARKAAQYLRQALHDGEGGFIAAVVAVSGSNVVCEPHLQGDLAVTATAQLARVRALNLPGAGFHVDDVYSLLRSLDLPDAWLPAAEALAGEGFLPGVRPVVIAPTAEVSRSGESSKDRRRKRRLDDLREQADAKWNDSHRKRAVASALSLVLLALLGVALPLYCFNAGLVVGALVGAWQLRTVRPRYGDRTKSGRGPMFGWLLSLAPFVGLGAALAWAAALPAVGLDAWPFVLILAILLACVMGCAILAGRNGYVYPPALVVERFDEKGRPTGAFNLVEMDKLPDGDQGWRPVVEDVETSDDMQTKLHAEASTTPR